MKLKFSNNRMNFVKQVKFQTIFLHVTHLKNKKKNKKYKLYLLTLFIST